MVLLIGGWGEGLGIPSPLLGCLLLAGFAGDDAPRAVFSSILLVQQTVEIPQLQFICVVGGLPVVTLMPSLMSRLLVGPLRFPSCLSARWSMSLLCRMCRFFGFVVVKTAAPSVAAR